MSTSCTLSVSSAFTPDSIADNDEGENAIEGTVGGYGDILKALEKMDKEGHTVIMKNSENKERSTSNTGSINKSGDKMR